MSGKTLYLECYSGISGDMTVAALLDLGASRQVLEETLASLHLDGYELRFGRVQKRGIEAADFDVILEDHDHDHKHEHDHEHGHSHEHRTYADIRKMLEEAELNPGVRERALQIFEVVARAEGRVHGRPMDEVHFHEVGAVDSIVDIVGTAACLEDLGIEKIYMSSVYEGTGHVWCQHGQLPVPVPAVAQMTATYDLPLVITEQKGEMVTPTGAAILAALADSRLPETFRVRKIGYGAGKKDFARANVLRAMLIEPEEKEEIWELESNIDDCSGEMLGYAMDRLLEAGAADVFFTPIFMKKNRPAYKISVLCREEHMRELEEILFRETTTIGIRRSHKSRNVMKREICSQETELYGKACTVQMKICRWEGGERRYPEYESVRALAERFGKSYKEIYKKLTE